MFSYTVAAGENTADLTVTGANLGGGTIRDRAGNNADLSGAATNPAGILQIDTIAPTVSSIVTSGPGIIGGNGALNAGKTVTLTVKFGEVVTVGTGGGRPTLTLNDGGIATYVSGSGTRNLVFSYTVAAGENTGDLTVTGASLGGGTIRDGAGNNANLSGAATNPAGTLIIDTTPPVVSSPTTIALEDSGPTPIGIKVSGGKTVTIDSLPDDGTVFLANGVTRVRAGQKLTVAQLEGLTFQPPLNEHDRS